MRVIVSDMPSTPLGMRESGVEVVTMDDLLKQSDFISHWGEKDTVKTFQNPFRALTFLCVIFWFRCVSCCIFNQFYTIFSWWVSRSLMHGKESLEACTHVYVLLCRGQENLLRPYGAFEQAHQGSSQHSLLRQDEADSLRHQHGARPYCWPGLRLLHQARAQEVGKHPDQNLDSQSIHFMLKQILVRHLLLEAMHLLLVASCYY